MSIQHLLSPLYVYSYKSVPLAVKTSVPSAPLW